MSPSRRKRRHTSNTPLAAKSNAGIGCLFALGIVIVCIGLMWTNMLLPEFVIWLHAPRYIATELIVERVSSFDDEPLLYGRVASTGEQVYTRHFPPGFYKETSPGSIVSRAPTTEEVRGKRVAIWFDPVPSRFSHEVQVVYRANYPTLPGGATVLGTLAVELGILGAGAALVWVTGRRLRAAHPRDPTSAESKSD